MYDQSGEVITLLYRPDGSSYPINYENKKKKKKKKIRKQPTRVKVLFELWLLVLALGLLFKFELLR